MIKNEKSFSRLLKHKISFLENIVNSEIEEENWVIKFDSYAEIIAVCENKFESLENFNFGHVITQGYFIFRIRFLKELNIKLRIFFRNRHFEIKRIININEENRILQLIALEI